jgi:hypothetical protein
VPGEEAQDTSQQNQDPVNAASPSAPEHSSSAAQRTDDPPRRCMARTRCTRLPLPQQPLLPHMLSQRALSATATGPSAAPVAATHKGVDPHNSMAATSRAAAHDRHLGGTGCASAIDGPQFSEVAVSVATPLEEGAQPAMAPLLVQAALSGGSRHHHVACRRAVCDQAKAGAVPDVEHLSIACKSIYKTRPIAREKRLLELRSQCLKLISKSAG